MEKFEISIEFLRFLLQTHFERAQKSLEKSTDRLLLLIFLSFFFFFTQQSFANHTKVSREIKSFEIVCLERARRLKKSFAVAFNLISSWIVLDSKYLAHFPLVAFFLFRLAKTLFRLLPVSQFYDLFDRLSRITFRTAK